MLEPQHTVYVCVVLVGCYPTFILATHVTLFQGWQCGSNMHAYYSLFVRGGTRLLMNTSALSEGASVCDAFRICKRSIRPRLSADAWHAAPT